MKVIHSNTCCLLSVLILIIVNLIFVICALLIKQKNAAKEIRILSNFRQVEVALIEYHKDHGSFPKTRNNLPGSELSHSWRVSLLDYLSSEWQQKAPKYNYAKAWDSAENLEVVGSTSPIFYTSGEISCYTKLLSVGALDSWDYKIRKGWVVKYNEDSFYLFEDSDSKVLWNEPRF